MSVYLSCLSVLVCLSVCLCRLSDCLSGPSVGQAVLVPLQGQIRLARRQPEAVSWQVGFALLASVSVSQSCASPAPARPLHPLHVLFLSVMEFPSARAGSQRGSESVPVLPSVGQAVHCFLSSMAFCHKFWAVNSGFFCHSRIWRYGRGIEGEGIWIFNVGERQTYTLQVCYDAIA